MKKPAIAKEFLEDFISLIFPKVCIHCGIALVFQEEHICTSCRLSLPKTDFHLFCDNLLKQKFVFEQKVQTVSAYLYFNKGGIAQSLIHELKYKGNKEIGEDLGKWYGHDLKHAEWPLDVIIPVPLHRSKERKRGYNQSYHFALGLSEALAVPVEKEAVQRIRTTLSQTHKTKVERWLNIGSVYEVTNQKAIAGKNVLVVDDVLTTGATIGELIGVLVSSGVSGIYIATIAAGK